MEIVGNTVRLDGNELATAIDAYLTAHSIRVNGPRTTRVVVDGDKYLARDVEVEVFVDLGRCVIDNRVTS